MTWEDIETTLRARFRVVGMERNAGGGWIDIDLGVRGCLTLEVSEAFYGVSVLRGGDVGFGGHDRVFDNFPDALSYITAEAIERSQ